MIQHRTMLVSADNTGARRIRCIRVLGGYKKRYAYIGDVVTVSIKEALPHTSVKKGEVAPINMGLLIPSLSHEPPMTLVKFRRDYAIAS